MPISTKLVTFLILYLYLIEEPINLWNPLSEDEQRPLDRLDLLPNPLIGLKAKTATLDQALHGL